MATHSWTCVYCLEDVAILDYRLMVETIAWHVRTCAKASDLINGPTVGVKPDA